jgi:signal transduction histidine kinase
LQDRLDEFSRDEISQFVAVIAAQGKEVADLVEDLLVITRAEVGHLGVSPAPVYVAGEVRRVKESLPKERHDQETMLDLSDVVAWADPLRVRQIIRNLLTNSARYGGSQARVLVEPVEDEIVLVVADNGPGIPESDREAIFQAYGRCSTSITQPGSIGLGLTVSRYLAEVMGGTLTYDRLEGESRFTLRLPAYGPGSNHFRRP